MDSDFKRMVEEDIHAVFLNLEEFGSTHIVEGLEIDICLFPYEGGETDQFGYGLAANRQILFGSVDSLPPRREKGEMINIDGSEFLIDKWDNHMGMATVMLSHNSET